ncbi:MULTISPECIES: sigma-70 family RNA polymerase sigma factor [unclassified Sphingomonas]|uniref:sigma-70 family RNA polymerase sigma factor n=1 Tax=unclassified Sphingomonas TaxID=196159 RepID=UPI00226A69AF|nr:MULTISPECIES: sigma-70 family RNA polymerase sigma factor [unclassified Sphingomonas]
MAIAAAAALGEGELDYDFVAETVRTRGALLRYAQRLTATESARDDLVQDTLLRAWAARDRFAAGTSFRAWLFRIARNTFLSGIRRRRWQVDLPEEVLIQLMSEPASQEAGLHMRDLDRVVASLPPAQAEALIAVGSDDAGVDVVAERLGIPAGTLRSRTHRARQAVLERLDHAKPPPALPATAAPPLRDTHASGVYAAWKASGSRMIG